MRKLPSSRKTLSFIWDFQVERPFQIFFSKTPNLDGPLSNLDDFEGIPESCLNGSFSFT